MVRDVLSSVITCCGMRMLGVIGGGKVSAILHTLPLPLRLDKICHILYLAPDPLLQATAYSSSYCLRKSWAHLHRH